MPSEIVGVLGIIAVLTLMFLRMPVGAAMIFIGIIGFAILANPKAALSNLGSTPFNIARDYPLSVIPMFILMGMILQNSGIGRDLFKSFNAWLGHLRGGLAMATIATCAAFAAVSGSVIATTATISRVTVPEMIQQNYKRSFAVGCAASGSSLGILIPPSGILVIYGILTEESIGSLLIAGILPGLLTAALLMASAYIQVRINPEIAPIVEKSATITEKFSAVKNIWPIAFIFGTSMGGIYLGIFTPTEAGAIGAFFSLLFCLVTRRINFSGLTNSLSQTVRITGILLMIVIGGKMFGQFLAVSRIPIEMTNFVNVFDVSPTLLMIIIFMIYFISGFFMEEMAVLVIYTPLFYPIVIAAGFDGVWFGVVTILMLLIGLLTPPVGLISFVASSVTNTPLNETFKGVYPFWLALVVAVFILIFFPDIVTYLPSLME
ncbi:MAG: TRAP transporter large permease [Clostridia bacterium]|jgi:tripartite ATP-independent transporter DctM subunit|nr:TRAP transporter large permease [Clostridia bacterium]